MPQIDHDQLTQIQATLTTITHMFAEVMTNGIPKRPHSRASNDEQSANQEWHETRWQVIKTAEQLTQEITSWTIPKR